LYNGNDLNGAMEMKPSSSVFGKLAHYRTLPVSVIRSIYFK